LDFYSASSLKQQTAGRHVAPLGHIILILNQSNAGLTVFNFFSVIDIMKKDLMPKIGFGLQLN
jgi:hypothetical protein